MTTRGRVVVRESIAAAGVALLRDEGLDVVVDGDSPLESLLADADALIVRSATKVTAEVLAQAPALKVIGRAGVGVDNVDVEAATRRGIVVANAPESNVVSAAEHTVGLLVALARNIPQAHAALREGRWERSRYGGVELADKTLGVLGFGRIGQQVARRALGLQMKVVGHDPYVSEERFRELGVETASFDEVLARSDFITLHLPLNDSTRGAIGTDQIARMRDGVRIINAARGELLDEAALVAALNGAFQGRSDQPVNYVNAPVIAADRGVEVVEETRRSSRDYKNLVAVSADGRRVAGTTIGTEDRQWLVSALGFQVEIELAPRMALLRYDDVPGVIGRVGTLFGSAGVNIANMAVSRSRDAGKALMALSIDSPVPPELIARLREGTDEAHVIQ